MRARMILIGAALFASAARPASDAAAQGRTPSARPDGVRVSAIRAKLFYENTGTFSEDVLSEKGFDLWNTPFDSTYSTFVVVELEGVPEYLATPRRVELTARYVPLGARRGVNVRLTELVRNGSESGKAYAGFWLRNTGCEPVYLTARLAGRRQRLAATINFGCGE